MISLHPLGMIEVAFMDEGEVVPMLVAAVVLQVGEEGEVKPHIPEEEGVQPCVLEEELHLKHLDNSQNWSGKCTVMSIHMKWTGYLTSIDHKECVLMPLISSPWIISKHIFLIRHSV